MDPSTGTVIRSYPLTIQFSDYAHQMFVQSKEFYFMRASVNREFVVHKIQENGEVKNIAFGIPTGSDDKYVPVTIARTAGYLVIGGSFDKNRRCLGVVGICN